MSQTVTLPDLRRRVATAICKSRTCEGMMCCQWPAQYGRVKCPVLVGAYDAAADAAIEAVTSQSATPAPTAADARVEDGKVPDRETFWLVERNVSPPQYVSTNSAGWHYDVWEARRFQTEREAHDYWRMMGALERAQFKVVEHLFTNKIGDALPPSPAPLPATHGWVNLFEMPGGKLSPSITYATEATARAQSNATSYRGTVRVDLSALRAAGQKEDGDGR